jgi:ACT domain-containing protein
MNRQQLAYAVGEIVLRHLPGGVEQERVSSIVADLVRLLEGAQPEFEGGEGERYVVVTVIGRNKYGIMHAFSEVLALNHADIVDINQSIVHGNFVMMMIVDPSSSRAPFEELKAALKKRGEELDVQVYCQFEDMMRALNRI